MKPARRYRARFWLAAGSIAIAGVAALALHGRDVALDAFVLTVALASFALGLMVRSGPRRDGRATNAARGGTDVFAKTAAGDTSLVTSRFVALVSHELRTPLGAIVGTAELLETTALTERQRQLTAAMRTSTRTLHRIADDLLDFARIEAGHMELVNEPYDLSQTIDDLVVLFTEQARQKNLAFHAFVDPAISRTLIGDQGRLKQILQNLVANALRFTAAGSVHIDVVPGRDPEGARAIHFAVIDTGCGIDAHVQEHIFDAFVQGDALTARRFGGTGLGLSIARHLVEIMSGRISLQSAIGAGSTFSFTIPFRPAARASLTAPLRDVSVLVVESAPDRRDLLQRYVDGWQMRSVTVDSLAQADAALAVDHARRVFDIVLVGAGVPEIDAVAFARREYPAGSEAPFGAILMRDDGTDISADRFSGYAACIAGPLRQPELFEAIVGIGKRGLIGRAQSTIAGVPAREARPERVLVVEDSQLNAQLLVAQLEHLGLRADVVGDGRAAVEAAAATRYDAIVMDCEIPEIDGFEAARLIHELPSAGSIPIIAVSANVLPGYRETCIAAGMQDYISKPALIGPLAAAIDRWLVPGNPLPATATVAAAAVVSEASRSEAHIRLSEVFHGDQERVERLIAMSHESLLDGTNAVRLALAKRDGDGAARAAHRMKGVALEIGFNAIAGLATTIQAAAQANAWDEAERGNARFLRDLVAATGLERELV